MRRVSGFLGFSGRGQRAATTRVERAALHRRDRARAHLERVRRGHPDGPQPWRPALLVLLASLGAGAVFGTRLPLAASLENVSVRGAERLSAREIAEVAGLERGASTVAMHQSPCSRSVARPMVCQSASFPSSAQSPSLVTLMVTASIRPTRLLLYRRASGNIAASRSSGPRCNT